MTFVTLDNLKTMLKYMSTSKAKTISLPANTKTKVLEITDSVFSCFVKINCSALHESTTLSIGCSGDKKVFISQLGGSAYKEPKFEYHITTSNGKCYFSITSNSNAEKVEIKVSEASSFTAVNFTSGVDSGNDLRTFKPSPYAHADERGLSNGVHGATSEAIPGQIVSRDEFGRAKVSAPVDDTDIANKRWVLDSVYPIGSLYWSSKPTNPGELFGGTWKQIKDCFVWAKGDSDAINATGGSKTVTLTEANMPSHSHSFTPSGTCKLESHKHSLNGHTHSYTPEGSVSLSLSFKEMSGTIIGAGSTYMNAGSSNEIFASASGVFSVSGATKRHGIGTEDGIDYNSVGGTRQSVTFSATPTLDSASASFSGTASHTGSSYDDTGYSSPSSTFLGETGTTSSYGGDSNGNVSSFNIMNPYIIKYCWERIA